MSREIKFRAWDKEKKELITGDDNQGSIFGQEGGYFDLRIYPEKYILMQYTGLKDKNGKEIYEGDIVKVYADGIILPSTDKNISPGYIPEWFKMSVEYEKILNGMYLNICNFKNYKELKYEVIGNIYENPELIG